MTHINRTFGQRPEFSTIAPSTTRFVKASLEIDKDVLLSRSRRVNNIAYTAARMCGEMLQLEGSYDEQKVVWLTHKYIQSLLDRPLNELEPEGVREIIGTDKTLSTLRIASAGMSSEGFDRAVLEYESDNKHFRVDSDGIVLTDPASLLADDRYKGKGCPYAQGSRTLFHDEVFVSVADTYITAAERNMPKGWFDQISRSLQLQ